MRPTHLAFQQLKHCSTMNPAVSQRWLQHCWLRVSPLQEVMAGRRDRITPEEVAAYQQANHLYGNNVGRVGPDRPCPADLFLGSKTIISSPCNQQMANVIKDPLTDILSYSGQSPKKSTMDIKPDPRFIKVPEQSIINITRQSCPPWQ